MRTRQEKTTTTRTMGEAGSTMRTETRMYWRMSRARERHWGTMTMNRRRKRRRRRGRRRRRRRRRRTRHHVC